ncbi:MAG: FimV/HubP family polar landmark protein, partial [Comamonas sp.]
PSAESFSPAAVAAAAAAARAQPIAFENTQPPAMTQVADGHSDFGPISGLDFAMSSQLTEAPDAVPDFLASASAAPVVAAPVAAPIIPAEPLAMPAATMDDFDRQLAEALSIPSELQPTRSSTLSQGLETQPSSLDFQMSDFEGHSTAQLPITDKTTHTMDFDMTSLSLELPGTGEPDRTHPAALADDVQGLEMDDSDPLATKLTLAQEFLAIGDKEGALSLAQEVLTESTSPTIKAQAQRLVEQSR